MKIEIKKNQDQLEIILEGRLDTVTTPSLEEAFNNNQTGMNDLTLNMQKVDYISSAGLRVILSSYKVMKERGGKTKLVHVAPTVLEVLTMTGFTDFLTIE